MCGISGIYGLRDKTKATAIVQKMNDCIAHRGPDDDGFYVDDVVALGHRRLAILDLSPAGHQPMHDADENLEIIFNGEVYNFLSIQKLIPEYQFKTRSDTEVILAAYRKWGKECLHYFNGMFAFAIWDKQKQELFIARDRLGIKPLYYNYKDGVLLFASEVRALLESNLVPRKINKEALPDYFTYQTVHAPATLIKDVWMLMPGHHATINTSGMKIEKWWSPKDNYSHESEGKTYKQVCDDIYNLLAQSVELRLISDVPFGAFLSGGIDSSAIVGLMSRVQKQPVKTFTIVFDEEQYSEAPYARQVSELFKTDHHEFRLTPDDFLKELPVAMDALDHPSGDGPNSYIVSRITRENGITMALSGLGGDELFAGYPVFNRSLQIESQRWLWKMPSALRKMAGVVYSNIKPGITATKTLQLLELENGELENTFPLSRQVGNPDVLRALLSSNYHSTDEIKRILKTEINGKAVKLPLLSQVSIAEITSYMQNVLLRDTDQMSMAVALEVRVPFLDYKLVEYVLGVKDEFKKPLFPKKLLVDSLNGLLPDSIVHRKKMGFVFPWEVWLKNELRPLCDSRIQSLAERNIVNGDVLRDLWKRFLQNDKNVRWLDIWLCVVLEHWMEKNNITE
ncbi:MAG: asparagine synthase (glutamine-hydrolyzing) [Bacteroidota bacterium]